MPILRFSRPSILLVVLCLTPVLPVAAQDAPPPDLRQLYAGPPESWPRPALEAGAIFVEFGPVPPPDRALVDNGLARIGERLFDERRLSGSGQFACTSCHNPELGFGDGLRLPIGHDRQRGPRHSPSLFTVPFSPTLFWDGRAASAAEQALFPILNPIEMAGDRQVIEAWINGDTGYRSIFDPVIGARPIVLEDVADALAAFQRTIRPPRNRWDRVFTDGMEVLDDRQLWGLHLFRTKAGCANCHSGPMLTDNRFHNLGLSFYGTPRQDLGRYRVTGAAADVGAFRTPSLRGLIYSRPYMHNGFFPFLEPVILFYNGGGRDDPTVQPEGTSAPPPQRDPLLLKRSLTKAEREALLAFLMVL